MGIRGKGRSDKGKRKAERGSKTHAPAKKSKVPFRANKPKEKPLNLPKFDDKMRLNKFLAHAGVCARREADTLIAAGTVEVNGEIVTELGFKIDPTVDKVKYGGHTVRTENKQYLVINKPKDFGTNANDPLRRRNVMQLVKNATKETVYPVGKLDRNNTGLLVMTNDADLAQKLTHPKLKFKKVFHVVLNKPFAEKHFHELKEGITLDDGFIKPEDVKYAKNEFGSRELGIEIHTGRLHIVRRIFEHLGYEVSKIDRVVYGGITKKDLKRGQYRMLTPLEIQNLKNI